MDVQHQDTDSKGAFFLARDGQRLAAMEYSHAGTRKLVISHTEVSDELRGQGAGRKLLDALVAWARAEDLKVLPLCPFARAQFEKDPSIGDVLDE